MSKRGPKPKKVNWAQFDKLCAMHCTAEEIASWFEVCVETLQAIVEREKGTKFSDYYQQKAARGKISLRRKQFQMALSGDRVMCIWLGKQYLGQSDKVVAATVTPDDENYFDEFFGFHRNGNGSNGNGKHNGNGKAK